MSFSSKLHSYLVNYFNGEGCINKAQIMGFDAELNLRVYIVFLDNDADLPNSTLAGAEDGKKCRLYYHIDQFSAVIDILRNEKPVYVNYWSQTQACISAGLEPIGEGEINTIIHSMD